MVVVAVAPKDIPRKDPNNNKEVAIKQTLLKAPAFRRRRYRLKGLKRLYLGHDECVERCGRKDSSWLEVAIWWASFFVAGQVVGESLRYDLRKASLMKADANEKCHTKNPDFLKLFLLLEKILRFWPKNTMCNKIYMKVLR